MLIKKTDIGAEILSILTKGMYLDPKDTIREYIQNGIDAGANEISVKIRQDTIVVVDKGSGMDKDTLRKAIRVGISDKNLAQNVGFMGIGIYSSFHLCDELYIYSRKQGNNPGLLFFNFKKMRLELEKQREERFKTINKEYQLIALQDLLEKNIVLKELEPEKFPKIGTRVEMIGIEPTFFKTLSKFEEVADYLERVIPLPFNEKFSFGGEIQSYINTVCSDHNVNYSLINLELQINEEKHKLYRPYKDSLFNPAPIAPEFITLKTKDEFFGIAWGCLNSSKNMIELNANNRNIRGFIIKKQGFTIGNRSDLVPYFKRLTYYNRYIGEIIVVHPKLLPNASRSEFEYSPLRIEFQNSLREMANTFNKKADEYQETLKAQEIYDEAILFLRKNKVQYELYIDNLEKLLEIHWNSKEFAKTLRQRKQRNRFDSQFVSNVEEAIRQLESFAKQIKDVIELRKKKKTFARRTQAQVSSELNLVPGTSNVDINNNYKSLNEVIESLGIEVNKELLLLFDTIDEICIRSTSFDQEDYLKKLLNLKSNFEDILSE